MMRSFAALCLVLFAVAPALAQDEPWLPLAPGNTWTYDSSLQSGTMGFGVTAQGTATATCTRVENWLGQEYHVITWRDEDGKLDDQVWVRSEGTRIQVGRGSDESLLLLPVELDEAKRGKQATIQVDEVTITLNEHRVGAPETVTCPAGTFECVPVSSRVQAPATVVETKVWYARGVGPVKILEQVKAGPAVTKRELTLRSFQAGEGATAAGGEAGEAREAPAGGDQGGPNLIRAIAAGAGDWAAAERRVATMLTRVGVGGPGLVLDAGVARRGVKGLRESDSLDEVFIVSDGDVSLSGIVDDAILLVLGDVRISGVIKDSFVACTGTISISSVTKDCVLLAGQAVTISAVVKDCAVEAPRVVLSGVTKDNRFLNVKQLQHSSISKNDVRRSADPSPYAAFLGE